MANTTTVFGRHVEITGLDANWSWDTDLPAHLKSAPLRRVRLRLSAAGDAFVLRAGSITGPRVWARDATFQTGVFAEFGPNSALNPSFAIADCTFTTPASASVIMEFDT